MHVDINRLTEQELIDLNHQIVARLRMLRELRAHSRMLEFRIGDRVTFQTDARRVTGVITRYNRKTVSVIADTGERWNVAPGFLERTADAAGEERSAVIELRRERPQR